jgi:CRP-like cAMP-binding protein
MLPRREAGRASPRVQEGGSDAMDQKLQMLANVPLFDGLGHRDLEEIGRLCDEVDLPAGRTVARQGASGSEFFVILDGTVSVDRDGAHLRDLGPGDFFGELALLGHVPRTASVTTTTDSRFLVLARPEFNVLLKDFPSIQAAVLQCLASRIATMEPVTA